MVASIASKFRRKNTPKGQIIHSVRDGFGLIEVVDTQVARSLYFGTRVEQSRLYFNAPMTLAFEYQEALMEAILEHPAAINRLLTLGLGGGSLPAQMHHIFPKCQQTVVELRPAVIDIAYRYFHLPETPHIDTREADAYMFVLQETERYDIIVIDLYDGDSMPPEFTDEIFLLALQKLTRPGGLLLFNLWKGTPEKTLRVIRFWEEMTDCEITMREIHSSNNLILSVKPR